MAVANEVQAALQAVIDQAKGSEEFIEAERGDGASYESHLAAGSKWAKTIHAAEEALASLTTPPTDAEREALIDDLSATVDWLKRTRNYVDADRVMRAIAALRRQEPITDAVEARIDANEAATAWTENNFIPGPNTAKTIDEFKYAIGELRAALEAARDAS